MGGDGSTREKKTKKRHYSSSSEEEDRGKLKRKKEGDEERKSKNKKEKKHRKHRSDKEKKTKDKHKTKRQKGEHGSKHSIPELSNDDYFSKNNEFATWLKEQKNIYFFDLSSESAREHFSDFVKAWNRGKLDSRFYEGILEGPRTAYNWKIKQ